MNAALYQGGQLDKHHTARFQISLAPRAGTLRSEQIVKPDVVLLNVHMGFILYFFMKLRSYYMVDCLDRMEFILVYSYLMNCVSNFDIINACWYGNACP